VEKHSSDLARTQGAILQNRAILQNQENCNRGVTAPGYLRKAKTLVEQAREGFCDLIYNRL
jgi:hypothetical protein